MWHVLGFITAENGKLQERFVSTISSSGAAPVWTLVLVQAADPLSAVGHVAEPPLIGHV